MSEKRFIIDIHNRWHDWGERLSASWRPDGSIEIVEPGMSYTVTAAALKRCLGEPDPATKEEALHHMSGRHAPLG